MPAALASVGIDPAALEPRNDGSALQFEPSERDAFVHFVETLLARLLGSDFALAFPDRPVIVTVHHHKQVWWTSSEEQLLESLDRLVPPAGGESWSEI
jgi:hypothetical protein